MAKPGMPPPGDRRRAAHARPVTPAARRWAGHLGLAEVEGPAPASSPAWLGSLPRPIGSLRRPRASRPAWLIPAALVVAAAVLVVAAGPRFDPGLIGSDAARPTSSTGPSAVTDARAAAPSAVPSPVATLTPVPSVGLPTGYRWPLDHARITAWFGPRSDGIFIAGGEKVHDGIDIASFCGDRIEAAHDGIVLVAGRRVDDWLGWVGSLAAYHARLDAKHQWGGRAIMVIVDDGDGYRSVYVHLSRAVVAAGQHVAAGQLLGYEGATGDATGCHLHFSLFSPTDPAVFQTDPALVSRLSLPPGEIARIDPLLVLPPMATANVTWGWGARD